MNQTDNTLTIKAADGGSFSAYIARPARPAAGAVIVIQEIFGVNAVMRGVCDHLASLGYIAICPDLFWRQEPGITLTDKSEAEWQRAFALYQGFDLEKGVADLKSTLAAARKVEGGNGKVGTIGYCLGGRLAFLMATRSDADCNVSYYGVSLEEHLQESGNISKPLLMHIAEKDKFVPATAREEIVAVMGKNPMTTLRVYPGVNHAFARVGGEHYDQSSATTANTLTEEFLNTYLT